MMYLGEEVIKEINKKRIDNSAIMVKLGAHTTINNTTAWEIRNIPFDTIIYNSGDKFTLNSSGSINYNGHKNLKVEVGITVNSFGNHSNIFPVSNFDAYYQDDANSSKHRARHFCIGRAEVIRGRVRANATGELILSGGSNYCYMIVEEI